MGAVYVDESLTHGASSEDSRRAVEAVSALHRAIAPDMPFHCVQLEDVFDGEEVAVDKGSLLVRLLEVPPRRPLHSFEVATTPLLACTSELYQQTVSRW